MAKIIEVNLPDEYKNKNKYEIFTHLEQVSTYAHKLKQDIEDLKGEIKLRDAQLQKQRSDILQLKSLIGHQKLEITDLKLQSEVEEAEWSEVENKVPNFLPNQLPFEEVKGNLSNEPIGK